MTGFAFVGCDNQEPSESESETEIYSEVASEPVIEMEVIPTELPTEEIEETEPEYTEDIEPELGILGSLGIHHLVGDVITGDFSQLTGGITQPFEYVTHGMEQNGNVVITQYLNVDLADISSFRQDAEYRISDDGTYKTKISEMLWLTDRSGSEELTIRLMNCMTNGINVQLFVAFEPRTIAIDLDGYNSLRSAMLPAAENTLNNPNGSYARNFIAEFKNSNGLN